MKSLSDLTFREIELFVLTSRTRSLREVARRSGLLPAHVSKIIQKLESKLGRTLFRRTTTGVLPTPDALSLLSAAEEILLLSRRLLPDSYREDAMEKIWTLGSISFISTYLLGPKIGSWSARLKDTRFRMIEFTHNDLVAHGLKGAFELAVHIERLEWTHSWEAALLGQLSWKLYGRKGHPLGVQCHFDDLLNVPFIVPADWDSHGYSIGEDFCPFSVTRRRKGDEASTAETALELCHGSNQLTFVPEILASSWCERQRVQEIKVSEWPEVKKDIFLTAKGDQVPHKLVKIIMDSFKKS